MSDYITTYIKVHFNPLSPNMEDIHIEDIAHALSLMTRANGHFPEFYSVAQHCIHCAKEAMARGGSPREIMLCLLHDSAEAYMADVTRPVKDMVKGYREAEHRLLNMICEKYMRIAPDEREKAYARKIDDTLLYHEFYHYMGEKIMDKAPEIYSFPEFVTVPFKEAEKEYLDIFYECRNKLEKMRKIRMIGVDLDGTLLNDKKQISERTMAALKKAEQRGIEIVPSTGRSFPLIPQFIKELPGAHYFITTNGAAVYSSDGESIVKNEMSGSDAADIISMLVDELGAFACVFSGGKYIAQPKHGIKLGSVPIESMIPPYASNYFNSGNLNMVESVADAVRDSEAEIVTVDLHELSEDKRKYIMEKLHDFPGLICVYGSPFNMDITRKDATKGNGLLKLGEILGIGRDEILACGDSGNDADMIRLAGFGAAMANADEFAKGAADFVTLSNEEDGVAEIIEKYIL